MHFPRFWAKGSFEGFACWWWSDSSEADARAQAQLKAQAISKKVKAGAMRGDSYGYPDRALREEIVQDLKPSNAVITRNSYGSLVLNTVDLMFVDIDFEPSSAGSSWLGRLFSGKKQADPSPIEQVTSDAERWLKLNTAWGFRVYLTKAGARIIATHAAIDPKSSICAQAFEALKCDPLYRRLCQTQKSFRARLSPKPWRCDLTPPPCRWPFESEELRRRYAEWQEQYQSGITSFASCKFVRQLGSSNMPDQIETLVDLHDRYTQAATDLPLA